MYEIDISPSPNNRFYIVLYDGVFEDAQPASSFIDREQLRQVLSWLRAHPITHYEWWDNSGELWVAFVTDANHTDFEALKGLAHAD